MLKTNEIINKIELNEILQHINTDIFSMSNLLIKYNNEKFTDTLAANWYKYLNKSKKNYNFLYKKFIDIANREFLFCGVAITLRTRKKVIFLYNLKTISIISFSFPCYVNTAETIQSFLSKLKNGIFKQL